jgi:hypothetical protein
MFLKAVTEMAVDFDHVRAAMERWPERWLADLAVTAGADGARLIGDAGLEFGYHGLSRLAGVQVGDAVVNDRVVSLPFRLCVHDDDRLFPSAEGSLDAAWLGPGRTHLALSAQYRPAFGDLDGSVDRALLHRVVEAVAQRFVEAAAERLKHLT